MVSKKFIRYGIVGAVGTVTHLGLLLILVELMSLSPIIASSIAFMVVVIISYYLNYTWTFKAKNNPFIALIKYLVVCSCGFSLNAGIMFLVVDVLHGWYLLGQVIAIVVIPISNFLLNSYWAFKV